MINGGIEQFNGREGETAALLSRCLFNSELRVGGFAPRQLIPFTAKNYAMCRNTNEVNEVTVSFRFYSVRASALLSTSLMHSF